MKKIITYAFAAILAGILLWLILEVKSCLDDRSSSITVTTPADTNFAAVEHRDYRPPSTPFEHQKKPTNLPSNVKESDVKQVIIVTKDLPLTDSTSRKDTTAIIITKKGDIYVARDGGEVTRVEVITYKPAILQFGLFPSAGVTIGQSVSPAIACSPLLIYGKLKLPLFAADYNVPEKLLGIGAGAAYKVWRIDFGLLAHWDTNVDRKIKFLIAYNF